MAYKEKFPLDITPQGDEVRDSIKKNRNEILEVAKAIDLKSGGGSGGGGLRNRVLSGKSQNGKYNYLTTNGLSVTIDGGTTPVVVSFANGYNNFGNIDYVAAITKKESPWSVPPNNTSYLYVERSNNGVISYGSTTVEPERQSVAPRGVQDSMYYNTVEDKMYVHNGVQWQPTLRVVIGSVVTDASRVKTITYDDPTENTVTDNMIGTRRVDGADYEITAILNKMADAIKAIAGDEHLTSTPATTLKSVMQVINGLGNTYYKRTDTVANATKAARADEATHATRADTATNATNCVNKSGDTMTGNLVVPAIQGTKSMDFNYYSVNKVPYTGMIVGEVNQYNIDGTDYWGVGFSLPYNTGDNRTLGGQLFMANSNKLFYRVDDNKTMNTPWRHIAYFDGNSILYFPNGTKLRIE